MPVPGASATLRDRILGKIVMPGPATPCATWVGAYNVDGRRSGRRNRGRRPVISAGVFRGRTLYVAPTLLQLAGIAPSHPAAEAGHRCPCGVRHDGLYSCVDLDHLCWVDRTENEADKRR
jgi:hypothetical protein